MTISLAQISDDELVLVLIEMMSEPGLEQMIWKTRFSPLQRLEVRLHRWLCPCCRVAYPRYRRARALLKDRVAAKQKMEQQKDTIHETAARQLRSLVAQAWPAARVEEKNASEAGDCQDFTHRLWDAYLRHRLDGRA